MQSPLDPRTSRVTNVHHDVIVVGAGPTGLMLAAELALAGVDVALVERRRTQSFSGTRAGGLHARSIEMLDQRGIAERFLSAGQTAQVAGFAGTIFDLSSFPTRHPYGLALWQNEIERILAERVAELEVPVYRDSAVTGLEQFRDGVRLKAGSQSFFGLYAVGCDGGHSTIRRLVEIDFPGTPPTISHITAEVDLFPTPELGVHNSPHGIYAFGRESYTIQDGKIAYAENGPVRVMVTERTLGTSEPTVDDLRAALVEACGTDYGANNPIWISRFTDAAFQAEYYRKGRVLLAGDAAHIHPPDGGQGLNLGLQDAFNLGWKLARVIAGKSRADILDTYHHERHPVAKRAIRNALASVALRRTDARSVAAREVIAELLKSERANEGMAAAMSGLDVGYPNEGSHPLCGRRIPDVNIAGVDGASRIYELLHDAQPVLLSFRGSINTGSSGADVRRIVATADSPWDLPIIGQIPAPDAVLIRPDGYVAWAGSINDVGLRRSIGKWFLCGPPLDESDQLR